MCVCVLLIVTSLIVSTSAVDCLGRLVFEMSYGIGDNVAIIMVALVVEDVIVVKIDSKK